MSSPHDAFTGLVHPEVLDYLDRLGGEADPLLDRLEAHGAERGFPLIGRASGRWLGLMTTLIGGRRVFEFGSGFGYSAAFFARAVGPQGEVFACERDAWEQDAYDTHFDDPELRERITYTLGDAHAIFQALPGSFDVVLIDCNKVDYLPALALAVPRLRSGGIVLADNVLWGGKTARPAVDDDASTLALQAFNRTLFGHPDLQAGIVPVGDGLALGIKR